MRSTPRKKKRSWKSDRASCLKTRRKAGFSYAGHVRFSMTETTGYGIIIYQSECGKQLPQDGFYGIMKGKQNEAENGIIPGTEETAADVG